MDSIKNINAKNTSKKEDGMPLIIISFIQNEK